MDAMASESKSNTMLLKGNLKSGRKEVQIHLCFPFFFFAFQEIIFMNFNSHSSFEIQLGVCTNSPKS